METLLIAGGIALFTIGTVLAIVFTEKHASHWIAERKSAEDNPNF